MTVYAFSRIPAFNPNTNPASVAKSATGSVYDIGDTGFLTPLNLTLVATNTVTTTLISDANGMFPDFTLVDRTQCAFKSGTQVFVLTTSTPVPGPQGDPGPASIVPGPPTTDASLLTAGTVADARLPVRLGDAALTATYIPKWKANTEYLAGDKVLSPGGDVVSAKVDFTSGASYSAANWNLSGSYAPATGSTTYATKGELPNATTLEKWFSGGVKGKKIVFVGDSTTDYAYGLTRAMNYYTRRGRELAGVGFLNYGVNGQTLASWQADSGTRYGVAGTVAQNADLYVLSYGINDVRTGAMSEDTLVTNLSTAVDSLRANGTSTVLLRMPPTFTTTDTAALGSVVPNSSAQAYSTLLRNAYIRVAAAKGCALLDTQALVFGLTSKADTQSPYMLNQIHPNDSGNTAIARELVKMIGVPATAPPVSFSMPGKVAVGTIGAQVFPNGGRVAYGFANYRPINASGSLTIELRKLPANTLIGTVTYTGGYGAQNVMTPDAAAGDWVALAAGDSVQVAVTACTVATYDLEVLLIADQTPPARVYPLQLRGAGLVSSLDGSVVYAATEGLPAGSERAVADMKAVSFKRLNSNRFTKYSQDVTKSAVWTTSNVTITGTPGNQVITATATASIAALNAPVTPGEQLTFSWRATATGTPKHAVYDSINGAFIVAAANWPAADGSGWRSVTFTVPAGCTSLRCYPLSASVAIGDAVTLTGMQLSVGATMTPFAPTNAIGTAMTVNTGALPSEFTLINMLKYDGGVGTGVASPGGPNTDGNPTLQTANGTNFGYTAIATRGVAPRGANGAWQAAVLRVTGGNAYGTVNDQAQSVAYAKAVNATDLRWNYLSAGDTTGSFQTWDGEIIAFYFPYLLTEGEAAAFVRAKLLTLRAAGETLTADIQDRKLY